MRYMKGLIKTTRVSVLMAILLGLTTCTNSGTNDTTKMVDGVKVIHTEEISEGVDKNVASLSIEGMACEMMCGNMISGTLAELVGVKETTVDFEGAGEVNTVNVEYDKNQTSEKEMIEAVHALADGHYKVKAVKLVYYKGSGPEAEKGEGVSAAPSAPDYRLPNIFSVFTRL
jgi:copper chaperone CopZ